MSTNANTFATFHHSDFIVSVTLDCVWLIPIPVIGFFVYLKLKKKIQVKNYRHPERLDFFCSCITILSL